MSSRPNTNQNQNQGPSESTMALHTPMHKITLQVSPVHDNLTMDHDTVEQTFRRTMLPVLDVTPGIVHAHRAAKTEAHTVLDNINKGSHETHKLRDEMLKSLRKKRESLNQARKQYINGDGRNVDSRLRILRHYSSLRRRIRKDYSREFRGSCGNGLLGRGGESAADVAAIRSERLVSIVRGIAARSRVRGVPCDCGHEENSVFHDGDVAASRFGGIGTTVPARGFGLADDIATTTRHVNHPTSPVNIFDTGSTVNKDANERGPWITGRHGSVRRSLLTESDASIPAGEAELEDVLRRLDCLQVRQCSVNAACEGCSWCHMSQEKTSS